LGRARRRILVVDDDADTCALIVDVLTAEGYAVTALLNGEKARDALERERFDLILADIKMPRITGLDLLQYVRRMGLDTKFILMTAYASLETAIQALRGEAFDYLVKPFPLNDLRARVREALPEHPNVGQDLSYGDLRIDLTTRRVWLDEQEVILTRQEYDVLACLFEQQGCTVLWQELLERVWGYDDPSKENLGTLRSCIRRLRVKLDDDARCSRYIVNKWGEGYRLGE
jgi:DNA-binding response OmpR family regulator